MSARSARSASEIPPESPHPRALAVTNYINADGTSRAIAVFTARLRAPCPAGIPPRRHQRRRGRRLRGRRNMAGPRGGTAGLLGTKAANHRHHAENPQPRPRPPIRHRLRGSCIPSLSFFFPPLFIRRRPLLSFHPRSALLPPPSPFFPFVVLARFNAKPRRLSSFFIAVPGKFANYNNGGASLVPSLSFSRRSVPPAMLLESREPKEEEPPWRRGVTVPPLLQRRLAFADRLTRG